MNLFSRGIAKIGGLVLGGTQVTATAAELNTLSGVTRTAAQINLLTQGVAAGYKIARGQVGSITSAVDTISTGLGTVVAAVANLEDAPVIGCMWAQAVIGDQSATPVAGSILVKTWKPTGTADVTPTAATTFGKKINWIAIGT